MKETADRMGYIPNTMAASLRSGYSHMIAVIVNDLHNQHYCDLINQMDRELRQLNYTLMILCMQLEDDLAEKLIHTAVSLAVDGILYFPSVGQRHYVEYMISSKMPFVLLDRRGDDLEADTVRCDDESGGYLAGEHLIKLGHRKFLFLSGVDLSSSQIDRLNGFMKAVRQYALPDACVQVIPGDEVEMALRNNNLSNLIFPGDYTAIVCFRDEVAYPVMNALRDHGITIPESVSVISFDNLYAENPSRPPVTSIYCAGHSIASLGVKMLMERIKDPAITPRNMTLPVQIFNHGTTGPVHKADERSERK